MLPHVSIFTHTLIYFLEFFFLSLGPRESFPSETGVTDRKDNNWRMKIFSKRFDFRPATVLPFRQTAPGGFSTPGNNEVVWEQ